MSQNIIESLCKILQGTPFWVWGVFAYLLFVGLRATRDHVVYLPKLFIIPAILVAFKYTLFVSGNSEHMVIYLACMAIGLGIGFFVNRKMHIKILKNAYSIELPGSYAIFTILLLFFFVKYFFGYLKATQPDLSAAYGITELSISALFSGYFLGRAAAFWYRYSNEK